MPHAVSAQATPFFFRLMEFPLPHPVNFILGRFYKLACDEFSAIVP